MVGQGGMGTVWQAHTLTNPPRKVAVKEVIFGFREAEEQESAGRQFRREAELLAGLSHVGLVAVLDSFSIDMAHYLVMDLIEGQSLGTLVENLGEPLPVPTVVNWGEQLCDVLHYLHTRTPPVIYRDLKPDNVMVDDTGRLRLVDFGIARTLEAGSRTTTFIKGSATHGFAPAEQYSGGNTDVRTDIYALGATLYCLLTAQTPPPSIAMMMGEEKLTPPRSLNLAVPERLSTLVQRMMGLRRHERPDSVLEVWRELAALSP
jgi:serine/threonine-protein kinase